MKLTKEIIEAALKGLATQRLQLLRDLHDLEGMIAELKAAHNGPTPKHIPIDTAKDAEPTKRKISPAARKRMADAQKRRWAAYKKAKAVA